jgi:hypothetical protein
MQTQVRKVLQVSRLLRLSDRVDRGSCLSSLSLWSVFSSRTTMLAQTSDYAGLFEGT